MWGKWWVHKQHFLKLPKKIIFSTWYVRSSWGLDIVDSDLIQCGEKEFLDFESEDIWLIIWGARVWVMPGRPRSFWVVTSSNWNIISPRLGLGSSPSFYWKDTSPLCGICSMKFSCIGGVEITLSIGFDLCPEGVDLFLQSIGTGGAERITFAVKFSLVAPPST